METLSLSKRPSKSEQRIAEKSHEALSQILERVHSTMTEIEIEETKEKLQIPSRALELLNEILRAMSQGKPISIVPVATEVTTQKAAEILGCSRPHLVKLLENGELDFIKVGRHRRIKFEDVVSYKQKMKAKQKSLLIEMMNSDEELGGYDS
ncbi:helix-turn-helix domain-containing protein [Shivajiella indica]|jgi:excisionase family DNA binding protein|uniref:Helix-turn-helix domain-containing protein n=1 Tax=Shivajiella indica TaxID=872115 RepID=A0ABW5BBU3_9BACT